MPNFAGALKSEIRRLARKEVRASVTPLRKLVAGLRRRVAQQRRLIADLERSSRRTVKSASRAAAQAADETQIRFSPAWVKKHRKKLKMSRRVYARLVGVSAQSIFGWETGRTRPRRRALESWRKLRSMGVRELKSLPGSDGAKRRRAGRGKKRGRPGRPKAKRAGARILRKRGVGARRRAGRGAARKRTKRRVAGRAVRRGGMRRAAKKK